MPEPPRNRNGYRLWSPARVSLVRQLIREGRLHQRTVIHREPVDDPAVVLEVAREVSQFLKDAQIPLRRFVRELNQAYSTPQPSAGEKTKRLAGRNRRRTTGSGRSGLTYRGV